MFIFVAFACALRTTDTQSANNRRAAKIRSISLPDEYNLERLVENADKKHLRVNGSALHAMRRNKLIKLIGVSGSCVEY